MNELKLRYGINPHQYKARVYTKGILPFEVLNGSLGYINFLDALNAWQLVKEVHDVTGVPVATSFKHVSPAGVGLGIKLGLKERSVLALGREQLSLQAIAYARARGADRMSSYGDWIAFSSKVDLSTALLIKGEVSDGVVAPEFTNEAIKILRNKKAGNYRILKIDKEYNPPQIEKREIFGITLEQQRNNLPISSELLKNIPTTNTKIDSSSEKDIFLALITLKYTQSNSVCVVYKGQTIGIAAGQQSRIHCTQLAIDKAIAWHMRFHPILRDVRFHSHVRKHDRDTWLMQYVGGVAVNDDSWLRAQVKEMPKPLTGVQKKDWLAKLDGAIIASDGFFPHQDSIDLASRIGIKVVVQPGGSIKDKDVIQACNDHGMVMVFTGLRLFHH